MAWLAFEAHGIEERAWRRDAMRPPIAKLLCEPGLLESFSFAPLALRSAALLGVSPELSALWSDEIRAKLQLIETVLRAVGSGISYGEGPDALAKFLDTYVQLDVAVDALKLLEYPDETARDWRRYLDSRVSDAALPADDGVDDPLLSLAASPEQQ